MIDIVGGVAEHRMYKSRGIRPTPLNTRTAGRTTWRRGGTCSTGRRSTPATRPPRPARWRSDRTEGGRSVLPDRLNATKRRTAMGAHAAQVSVALQRDLLGIQRRRLGVLHADIARFAFAHRGV